MKYYILNIGVGTSCSAADPSPWALSAGIWQRSRRGNAEWCHAARGPNTIFLWCGLCVRRHNVFVLIGGSFWTRDGDGHAAKTHFVLHDCWWTAALQLLPREELFGIKQVFGYRSRHWGLVTSQLRATDVSAANGILYFELQRADRSSQLDDGSVYRFLSRKQKCHQCSGN